MLWRFCWIWPATWHPCFDRAPTAAPIMAEGLASFRKATVELLLGADNAAIKEGRVATLQVGAGYMMKKLEGGAGLDGQAAAVNVCHQGGCATL